MTRILSKTPGFDLGPPVFIPGEVPFLKGHCLYVPQAGSFLNVINSSGECHFDTVGSYITGFDLTLPGPDDKSPALRHVFTELKGGKNLLL